MSKRHYSITEAVTIAIRCAADYKENLENRNYIFVYKDRLSEEIRWFEAVFLPRNFMHLTGLSYTKDYLGKLHLKGNKKGAVNFYEERCSKTIQLENLEEKTDGTMSLKMDALPYNIFFAPPCSSQTLPQPF